MILVYTIACPIIYIFIALFGCLGKRHPVAAPCSPRPAASAAGAGAGAAAPSADGRDAGRPATDPPRRSTCGAPQLRRVEPDCIRRLDNIPISISISISISYT